VKKIAHKKTPLELTVFVPELRKSLEQKEEEVATDTRERDSLARHLADLERAAKEMAQTLKRLIETRPNLLNEVKALSARLTRKRDAISKRLKANEGNKISRLVASIEKAFQDQSAKSRSTEREVQTATRKYIVAKERADEADEERRRVLNLSSVNSKELQQARDLQSRIEIAEAKNPELAWALSIELRRVLNRLKGPSASAFENKLNAIWMKWKEAREALRQAALSRDAAVAQFDRARANSEEALKHKTTLIESALNKRSKTGGFQGFLTLPPA
jgi:hypothetical protein